MRSKFVLLAAAATLCGATGVASLAAAANGGGSDNALTCVGPTDARGIDALLSNAGSPLAGQGGTFVTAGVRAGIDPRLLVAIAAQETMLETYGPARVIHNAFGLGPGIAYATDAAGINAAADNLARGYIADGVTTIPTIARRWAPPGAANDPGNLNASWPSGVGQFFRQLGGNPDAPVLLTAQPSGCTGTAAQTLVTVKPLGAVRATFIQGPDDRGGTHDPAFNLAGGSYNWQSIWAVDLGVPVGTPVYAVFSGRIVTVHSGESGRFAGIGVGLESGRGLASYYAHLSSVRVAPGQQVTAGQQIGTTGEANGVAHLHFALGRSYADGSPSNGLDPRPFLAHAAVSAAAAVVRLSVAVTRPADVIPLGSGRPVVTVWGGNTPSVTGSGPSAGDTPGTTSPATVAGFAFPLAVRPGGKVRYAAPNCTHHVFCAVTLHAHAGTAVVAASAGTLEAASPTDRSHGIGFWIATPASGRLAYGPLATYAHHIGPGITVTAGQKLGTTAGALALGWTQYDVSVNPWPLLTAVRPTD
jgi:murein DD-endopeptidase MepM/ murein hydrolase activator NlpD